MLTINVISLNICLKAVIYSSDSLDKLLITIFDFLVTLRLIVILFCISFVIYEKSIIKNYFVFSLIISAKMYFKIFKC